MADVFISYHVSPGTSALVRNIADELESMGISCWYAPRNVTPGAFVPSILDAIACCKAFLMILDEGANGPGYVYNEMLQAFNRFKLERQPEIIPFKLGTFTTIPDIAFYLAPFHTFEGGMSAETAHTEELIHKISALFHKAPAKQSDRETKPAPIPQATPEPLPVPPVEIVKRGKCGDNVTYTLDENGVLTISGTGSMEDFKWSFAHWHNERISLVWIQNGVSSIGDSAFKYCGLESVIIPKSVTRIGIGAFCGCNNLTSVRIPDSVTRIERHAFSGCSKLTSVTIPDRVTFIGYDAFSGCAGLQDVTLPESVINIEALTFENCTGLTSVSIPNSVTSIGHSAFKGCTGLTSVTIPDSVTTIHNDAFRDCRGLTSVIIPNSVTFIGKNAFCGCVELTSVIIPDSVTCIGDFAFYDCEKLKSVSVPAKTIIADAFLRGVYIERRA